MTLEYEELQKEIKLQKEQQAVNLKDYGVKVRALDKEVKDLNKSKDVLLAEIKKLINDKDSKHNALLADARKIQQQTIAIKQEITNKVNELEGELKLTKKIKEGLLKQKAKNIEENNQKLEDICQKELILKEKEQGVDARFKETEKELWEAREYTKEVESLKGELSKAVMDVKAKKATNLDKENKLIEERLLIKGLRTRLGELIQYAKVNKSYIDEQIKSFNEQKVIALKELKSKEDDYTKKLADVIEQNNVNKLRALEIDAGFKELNEKSKAVKVEMRKLKEIKEQLMK